MPKNPTESHPPRGWGSLGTAEVTAKPASLLAPPNTLNPTSLQQHCLLKHFQSQHSHAPQRPCPTRRGKNGLAMEPPGKRAGPSSQASFVPDPRLKCSAPRGIRLPFVQEHRAGPCRPQPALTPVTGSEHVLWTSLT